MKYLAGNKICLCITVSCTNRTIWLYSPLCWQGQNFQCFALIPSQRKRQGCQAFKKCNWPQPLIQASFYSHGKMELTRLQDIVADFFYRTSCSPIWMTINLLLLTSSNPSWIEPVHLSSTKAILPICSKWQRLLKEEEPMQQLRDLLSRKRSCQTCRPCTHPCIPTTWRTSSAKLWVIMTVLVCFDVLSGHGLRS